MEGEREKERVCVCMCEFTREREREGGFCEKFKGNWTSRNGGSVFVELSAAAHCTLFSDLSLNRS